MVRNLTNDTTSSILHNLPRGTFEVNCFTTASSSILRFSTYPLLTDPHTPVFSTMPGQRQFTLMLSLANSKAMAWVIEMIAPFAPEYAAMIAEPVFPDLEAKLMIRPSFSFRMVSRAAWAHQTDPLMLIRFILSSRSGVIS